MGAAMKAAVGAAAVLVALGVWGLTRPPDRDPAAPSVAALPARAETSRIHAATIAPDPGPKVAPPAIAHEPTASLVVEVKSLRNHPVAGASVELRRIRRDAQAGSPPPESPDARANADAGGVARFPEVPGGEWTVTAQADGYAGAGASAFLAAPGPERRVTVHLDRGYEVRGIARDVAGTPVGGAVIAWGWERHIVIADAAGAFVLSGLPAGEMDIYAGRTKDGGASTTRIAVPQITTLDVLVTDSALVTVTGTVVDDATSAPIEGAVVRSRLGPESRICATDAAGRYRIEGLHPSLLGSLIAVKDGWLEIPVKQSAVPREPPSGSVVIDDMRLGRGVTVEGTVVTPDGPLEGAEVMLREVSNAAAPTNRRSLTDAAGRFAFPCAAAGHHVVYATAPGFIATNGREIEIPDSGTVQVPPILLTTGAVLEGFVLDAEGNGVPGAIVDWTRTFSDGRGAFRVAGKKPGPAQQIVAFAAGYADASTTVDVGPGTTSGVVIRLTRTATVRGRLVARDGRAIEDARVFTVAVQMRDRRDPARLLGDERGPFPVLDDGTFEVQVPESASVAFCVVAWTTSHAPARTEPIAIVPGQREYVVEVPLTAGTTLRGRVVAEGRGVAGATIVVGFPGWGYGPPPVRAVSDATGAFAIEHFVFPRGNRVHATASLPGYADAETFLTADAAGELVLERPVGIAGVVETGDHRPAANVGIVLHVLEPVEGAPTTQVAMAFTDADGRFHVDGLRPGRYRLVARTMNASKTREEIVTAGTLDVRLVLE